MSMTVSVEGLAALDKALAELPKATARNVLKRTLDKAAQPIVEEAKTLTPFRTGLVFEQRTWTWRALDEAVNRWAHELRARGVRRRLFERPR